MITENKTWPAARCNNNVLFSNATLQTQTTPQLLLTMSYHWIQSLVIDASSNVAMSDYRR